MSKRRKARASGAMLDLWRPPSGAGDPVGCLATTYTFAPGLFDEQCLARFLEIDSEPNREDLAFLLEREHCLGGVYAGVLVDYRQAGVDHSLRWDVLPVRLRTGKQHAKLSLLAWSRHVRILVASANLTEQGYRTNYEVGAAVDLSAQDADSEVLATSLDFLRRLLAWVPGVSSGLPEVERAEGFLRLVERQTKDWGAARRGRTIRRQLVATLPPGAGDAGRSALEEAVQECRRRGASPRRARVASPFFDGDADAGRLTAALCKLLARGGGRELRFCVPAVRDEQSTGVPRLLAPAALVRAPAAYETSVSVEILPDLDGDKNRRPWHAKMLALRSDEYSALMIGSSNFTCAGMGVGDYRNAEVNLLTVVDRVEYGREVGLLEAVWPETEAVTDPEAAEWLGARQEEDEEGPAAAFPLPRGFVSATYRAGGRRAIVLGLDPAHLPEDWHIRSCGRDDLALLSATSWREAEAAAVVEVSWEPVQPPEKLVVRWADHEAFLPLNVQDSRDLPLPPALESMSAEDMLGILAAADPSAAFRVWASQQQRSDTFDSELDSATPVDLDPLRRHDLQATFLHRIRRRARILAQLRANLQRPVSGSRALEWRLRGMVGVEPLADRLLRECVGPNGSGAEALLTLADFLIVLREVDYQPDDGSLSKAAFDQLFRPFLRALAQKLAAQIATQHDGMAPETREFWERVVGRCQE